MQVKINHSMSLFGTSGIRRLADKGLVELALKTGLAVGSIYDSVVVGRDTRTSGNALAHAFIAGTLAAGAECCDTGILPTPTLALATRKFKAGAMVTASHNPPEYNGIKLLNPDGSAFDAGQREQIEQLILTEATQAAPWDEIKSSRTYEGAIEEHIAHITKYFPGERKVRVVLDCACGAGSVITPYLLRKLGAEVLALNCYPSGFFPHTIEPTEDNLSDLMRATREFGADIGIAHDGDADRMMAIDEQGRFIPGDKLLVIFARQAGAKGVVTTVDASMAIDETGFNVTRTKVGDIYVSEELKNGGEFGGEPSGAWVFPHSSLCPDGIYAAAQIVAIASRQKLSKLVNNIADYPLLRGSVPSAGITLPNLVERLQELNPLAVNNVDGIRLSFAEGWLLIRPSGTEPKIRVTAQARSETRAHQLYDDAMKVIKDSTKGGKRG